MANETEKTLANSVRINFKFSIQPEGKQTANDYAIEQIASLFEAALNNDSSVVILPWKISDMDKFPAIKQASDIPDKITELRPYADRLRPKSRANLWCQMHFGCNGSTDDLTSTAASAITDWFDDNDAMGYKATVQGTDNAKPCGILTYSGKWSDHTRVYGKIDEGLRAKGHTLKFGCRVKKCKEITSLQDGKFRNWIMADDQLIHIECAAEDQVVLKTYLYNEFNKKDNRLHRPGGYNYRYLPDTNQIRASPSAMRIRGGNLKKHQAVALSLTNIPTLDIKYLDKECTVNGNTNTLRQIISNLTYPISPRPNAKNPQPMFHTVDFAATGRDLDAGTVYL
ncbi:MAG: hypothetical protein LC687_07970, partial [Actinobacteria bacterium]|nr:hypothetical protein [Actinomycetota bacterium]